MIELFFRLFCFCSACFLGDGGNDVSMIQAADAGIGIVGKVGYGTACTSFYATNPIDVIHVLYHMLSLCKYLCACCSGPFMHKCVPTSKYK